MGATEKHDALAASRPLPWPVWACFVACSWTWLIGMFLPVILMHDFGVWAWVIFAVPNAIGAASVGFVFRDPQRSRRFAQDHRPIMLAFSWVTLGFHFYVMGWFGMAVPMTLATLAFVAVAAVRSRALTVSAVAVFAVSMAAGLWYVQSPSVPLFGEIAVVPEGLRPITYLWLLCGTAMGFLTCPHLDLTLHRAAQQAPAGRAPLVFAVGFGVLFIGLVAVTGAYAPLALGVLKIDGADVLVAILPWALVVHAAVQVGFTLSCHLRELPHRGRGVLPLIAVAAVALAGLGMAVQGRSWLGTLMGWEIPTGDLLYRCWMGAYGVAFPAYVVLCVLPNRGQPDGQRRPTPRQVTVWIIATLVGMPLFGLGFIGGDMVFVAVAVGLILLALVLVTPRSGRTRPAA